MNTAFLPARRFAIGALLVALLLALGLCAFGCAPQKTSEEIIREGVTQEFDHMQDTVSNAMGGNTGLSQFGVDDKKFTNAWLSEFKYTIDDIKVDGNQATATVTITCKSLSQALNQWNTQLNALVADPSTYQLSEDELNKKIGSMLMECINNAPAVTTTVQLPYVLEGNTWKPGSNFETELSKAFMGATQ